MYSKNSNWIDSLNRSAGSSPSKTTAPCSPGEVLVEKPGGASEDSREVGLPVVPLVGLEVGPGHAAARAIEGVKVIADRASEIPRAFKIGVGSQGVFLQIPAEQTGAIRGVILRITAAGQVAKDAASSFGAQAGVGPVQPELGLAHPGRPGHHGQRAWDQTSPSSRSSSSIPKTCLSLVIRSSHPPGGTRPRPPFSVLDCGSVVSGRDKTESPQLERPR